MIDLRSDSSSTPTAAMRQAMAEAVVGNDAFGEDPTANELESRSAKLLGKEAALFVSSGTMGNLVAVLAATGPGDAVLAGRDSHLVRFEAGAPARLGGVMTVPFADPRGRIDQDELRSFLELPKSLRPRLLVLENTHNSSGGLVLQLEEMEAYATLGRTHGLHLHLDGARLFNVAVALGCQPEAIVGCCDSVSICLSKCLSAPVGSMLVGRREFIGRARQVRFQLGGQMRQVGVLAAAGLVALDSFRPQIEEDHRNARLLAEGLAAIEGIGVDLDRVETNMVLLDVSHLTGHASDFEVRLEALGVYASVFSASLIRFITYRDITRQHVGQVLEIVEQVAREFRRP